MTVRILVGDCRTRLAELPDGSAQTCVTSPPYFGLRDYGHAGQLGLEQTPDAYVAELVAVFREVKRVMRDGGTLWLNLGDNYAGTGYGANTGNFGNRNVAMRQNTPLVDGVKAKDMWGIPWRVAFALQADGWYLRSDIIWHKPNPMPESVTDRPTKAHEYVFLLSESQTYHYDTAAIQEDATCPDPRTVDGFGDKSVSGKHKGDKQSAEFRKQDALGKRTYTGFNESISLIEPSGKRNKRTVWTVPTSPYRGAHFATFPPALIEPCILAGCPKGGTVLDPFGGAGTTGLVADRLGRNAVLCELNPEYAKMARERIEQDNPMFSTVQLNDEPLP